MKKILVIYYSRHGSTRKVGQLIAKKLRATIEEINDTKDRSKLISWDSSSFDEELNTKTKIYPIKNNPHDFDLVIIGTPIWDGISPPVQAYIIQNKFKKVAFFATFGASAENVFYFMEKYSKKKPVAVLEIQDRQILINEYKRKVKEFCMEIKNKFK